MQIVVQVTECCASGVSDMPPGATSSPCHGPNCVQQVRREVGGGQVRRRGTSFLMVSEGGGEEGKVGGDW